MRMISRRSGGPRWATSPMSSAASAASSSRWSSTPSRAMVTPDGWKLSLSDNDRCLLFNRREDPYEQRNLFYRDGHRDVISRLSKEIHAWQQRTGDKLAV